MRDVIKQFLFVLKLKSVVEMKLEKGGKSNLKELKQGKLPPLWHSNLHQLEEVQ